MVLNMQAKSVETLLRNTCVHLYTVRRLLYPRSNGQAERMVQNPQEKQRSLQSINGLSQH